MLFSPPGSSRCYGCGPSSIRSRAGVITNTEPRGTSNAGSGDIDVCGKLYTV